MEEALRLLGNLLATWKGDSFWLVVCGGSALLAQKIISRSTEDIRALAPDARETEDSLRWLISSFPVLSHLNRLPDLLTYLGHVDLITKFQR